METLKTLKENLTSVVTIFIFGLVFITLLLCGQELLVSSTQFVLMLRQNNWIVYGIGLIFPAIAFLTLIKNLRQPKKKQVTKGEICFSYLFLFLVEAIAFIAAFFAAYVLFKTTFAQDFISVGATVTSVDGNLLKYLVYFVIYLVAVVLPVNIVSLIFVMNSNTKTEGKKIVKKRVTKKKK